MKLEGKTALVTGSAQGISRAIAVRLARKAPTSSSPTTLATPVPRKPAVKSKPPDVC
jgi:hypothetical protein